MALEPNDQIRVALSMFALDMDPQKAIRLAAQVFNPGLGKLANGFHQMSVAQLGRHIITRCRLGFGCGWRRSVSRLK